MLNISTKTKIQAARLVATGFNFARKLSGQDSQLLATRRGLTWALDLNEGIDFAIYLMGAFEPNTIAAYKRLLKPGDIAIDIGANIGAHTLHLAKLVGSEGRVFAFEPGADIYQKLKKNQSLNENIANRIETRQIMLLAEDNASLPENIYARWPLKSTEAAHPLLRGVAISTAGARTLTLDTVIAQQELTHIDLIKLDVDGYEFDVLCGAQKSVATYKPAIIFEHSPYTSMERGLKAEAIEELLQEFGYKFFNLDGTMYGEDGRNLPTPKTGSSLNVLAIHSDTQPLPLPPFLC